jgi:CP12 domain
MQIDTKIKEAIKEAEEACAETGKQGECAAAWDEVEELSAAASHKKESVRLASLYPHSLSSRARAQPPWHCRRCRL